LIGADSTVTTHRSERASPHVLVERWGERRIVGLHGDRRVRDKVSKRQRSVVRIAFASAGEYRPPKYAGESKKQSNAGTTTIGTAATMKSRGRLTKATTETTCMPGHSCRASYRAIEVSDALIRP
jgi:hypothetical protein